ncbi:MAG: hypothetical protein KF788_20965 [Piscinibacter sp.]|nr:hypothetical protein [Piscinibacter sp.]
MNAPRRASAAQRWKLLSTGSAAVAVVLGLLGHDRLGMQLLGVGIVAFAGALLLADHAELRGTRRPLLIVMAGLLVGFGLAMLVRPMLMLRLMGWAD